MEDLIRGFNMCTNNITDADFEHHITIRRDEGAPRWAAYDDAVHKFADCGQDCLPETWKALNRRWRANVKHLYPTKQQDAHKAIKIKHGVDSFTELTIGQIWTSVQKMEKKMREELGNG